MTRILSLGQNNGITIMILNLAPLRSYHLDTLSSLNVSSRAKRIEVREIENEVVFMQPPRKTASVTGMSMSRQPLRPLANAHNTHANQAPSKGDKPAKAFSVYTDKSKNMGPRSSNAGPVRTTTATKRPSDQASNPRPTKMVRPHPVGGPVTDLSASKIEEMIERKVQEALASRALDKPAPEPPSEISQAVQRRLEALETKIQAGEAEEERAEGLRFLLMARQHKERGEDSSALKMYEMARPSFPGQEGKIQKKIDGLRAKIQAKRNGTAQTSGELPRPRSLATALIAQLPAPANSSEKRGEEPAEHSRKQRHKTDSDDDFNAPEENEDYSFNYQPSKSTSSKNASKSKASKRTSTLKIFTDTDVAPSPKTQHLLDIVNSRDVMLIKGLNGVGAKKARDLVEYLELQGEDEGGEIRSLDELIGVPGLGKRTVERAYEGIVGC
jgi:DNA uptake protein ComE-like DNA-binding protein